jgi:NADH:quinone reductase (non-electrogenic)
VSDAPGTSVVIVGAGFAGLGCGRHLAKHKDVAVTLIDRNDYHQFQPLLYQVATSQLARSDVAYSLHELFHSHPNVDVVVAEAASVDPGARAVTTTDGRRFAGDALVLAAGSRARFFATPGAEEHSFPLYTVEHADRLRAQIIDVFDAAQRDPGVVDAGALTFVVVGAGATGTEIAGALAEMIQHAMPVEYPDVDVSAARVVMVDHGDAVLGPFSEHAHAYAAAVLERDGVELRLGTAVKEVGPDHAMLSDDSRIATHTVIWCGGIAAAPLAEASGLSTGRGGRVEVRPDLTVEGYPGLYVLGDLANIAGPDGAYLPQLGSVALQSGQCAAKNILATAAGRPTTPFHYKDKGIMAMIGHDSAVAEVGKGRHEVHGTVAFLMWLGVHATLMTGVRPRVDAFMDWAWDYFSSTRVSQPLDRSDAPRIDWGSGPYDPMSTEDPRG